MTTLYKDVQIKIIHVGCEYEWNYKYNIKNLDMILSNLQHADKYNHEIM